MSGFVMGQGRAAGGSNRGFKNQRGSQRVTNPRVRKADARGASNAGAPTVKTSKWNSQVFSWPPPPNWWLHSVEEWIVYWWLKYKLHLEENSPRGFYYQGRVYTTTLFANKNFTQADFILPYGPQSYLGLNGRYKALVLDPYTNFTHNRGFDLERTDALDEANYILVYMEGEQLKLSTQEVMDAALRGRDLSDRRTRNA